MITPPAARNAPMEMPNSARMCSPSTAATTSVTSTAATVVRPIALRSAGLRSAVTERKIAVLPSGFMIANRAAANLSNSLQIGVGSMG
jgi:hypothetical protein